MTTLPEKGAGYRDLIGSRTYLAIDVETLTVPKSVSKKHPRKGHQRCVAVGVVALVGGEKRGDWHWLMNPGEKMDALSSEYNGITDDDLADAPAPAVVLAELDALLAQYPDAAVVCHNASFDIGVLRREYELAGMEMWSRPVYDTMWIGKRLGIEGIPSRPKLVDLAERYRLRNTERGAAARTRKAVKDCKDTADVLAWFHAEAARLGVDTADRFDQLAQPLVSDDVKGVFPGVRSTAPAPSPVPDDHYATYHGHRIGPSLSKAEEAAWIAEIAECVRVHCPLTGEKAQLETHWDKRLRLPLTHLLAAATDPGDMGTLLMALAPFIQQMTRIGARRWWIENHAVVKASPACTSMSLCPNCAVGQPCLRDVFYQLVGQRAIDYAPKTLIHPNYAFALFKEHSNAPGGQGHGIYYMANAGAPELAAYIIRAGINAYRKDHNDRMAHDLFDRAIEERLYLHDPLLALDIAETLAGQGRDRDASRIADAAMKNANTDPGYLELDVRRLTRAVTASHGPKTKTRKAPADMKRKPSPVELRPADRVHTYRFHQPR